MAGPKGSVAQVLALPSSGEQLALVRSSEAKRELVLQSSSHLAVGRETKPLPFRELSVMTDLHKAMKGNWNPRDPRLDAVLPRRRSGKSDLSGLDPQSADLISDYTSFEIADCALSTGRPNALQGFDVVGDSENVKKLLTLPYSRGELSMAVHRVGDALLVDRVDVQKLHGKSPGAAIDQLPAWVKEVRCMILSAFSNHFFTAFTSKSRHGKTPSKKRRHCKHRNVRQIPLLQRHRRPPQGRRHPRLWPRLARRRPRAHILF